MSERRKDIYAFDIKFKPLNLKEIILPKTSLIQRDIKGKLERGDNYYKS